MTKNENADANDASKMATASTFLESLYGDPLRAETARTGRYLVIASAISMTVVHPVTKGLIASCRVRLAARIFQSSGGLISERSLKLRNSPAVIFVQLLNALVQGLKFTGVGC